MIVDDKEVKNQANKSNKMILIVALTFPSMGILYLLYFIGFHEVKDPPVDLILPIFYLITSFIFGALFGVVYLIYKKKINKRINHE